MLTSRLVNQTTIDAEVALAAKLNADPDAHPDDNTEQGEHPEGRKRGGVVSVFTEGEARVFYSDTSGEWFGYDDLDRYS